jgi:hypothetical protein
MELSKAFWQFYIDKEFQFEKEKEFIEKDLIIDGKRNVFIHGGRRTGKSYLLQYIAIRCAMEKKCNILMVCFGRRSGMKAIANMGQYVKPQTDLKELNYEYMKLSNESIIRTCGYNSLLYRVDIEKLSEGDGKEMIKYKLFNQYSLILADDFMFFDSNRNWLFPLEKTICASCGVFVNGVDHTLKWSFVSIKDVIEEKAEVEVEIIRFS